MAKAINIETEIAKILTKYGDEVAENIQKVTKEIARKGAKAVKQNSQNSFGGTGKYAAGWTSQAKEGRYSAQGVIYNRSKPGLPHLLEHGHAKRGGGRTDGKEHIAPVEQEVIKSFEEAIKEKL